PRPGTEVGERWVIKSKFETPMLNFGDKSVLNPISGSTMTFPTNFGGESTPIGMWHQFGVMPRKHEGVFISVDDIPKNWLQNHYNVTYNPSTYNQNAEKGDKTLFNKVKSLKDLVGFVSDSKQKIGQIKQKTTLREAVVAIPYIVEASEQVETASDKNIDRKFFIEIPKQRYQAALSKNYGSAEGDSFLAAGPSISKQLQKMQRYVLPPQFDFINNSAGSVAPFVMYIFEFEYELDRDDLSYIWQNIAPRDYKKVSFQHQSVAHQLVDAEILNEDILEENENLRWMIFKVKQKGQEDYWSYVTNQVDKNTTTPRRLATNGGQYELNYNWPYDYVSFVEMIKMGVDVKFEQDTDNPLRNATLKARNIEAALPSIRTTDLNQRIEGASLNIPEIQPEFTRTVTPGMNIQAPMSAMTNVTAGQAAIQAVRRTVTTATRPSTTTTSGPRTATTATPMRTTTATDRGPGSGGGGSGY
ncbi:MAG TPA: hypothetical protein DCM40_08120, partial [Maribacter sp.]|nr:hypothetical protein [Maribacter sp.]